MANRRLGRTDPHGKAAGVSGGGLRRAGARFVTVVRERLSQPPVRSRRAQRWLLLVAGGLFVAAATVAYLHLPELEVSVRWWLLALVAVLGVPSSILVNAVEFRLSARLGERSCGMGRAIVVMTLARAANVLPLPGSTLVRIAALKHLGTTYGRGLSATATVGVAWVGAAFLVAGAFVWVVTGVTLGALGLGIGLAAAATTYGLVRWHVGGRAAPGLTLAVLLVDLALVGVSVLRLFVALFALGFPVTVAQAGVLTVAEVLASATAVFPGGLGIREVLAGGLAPVVGLPIALGVVASAVDRFLDYVILGPACFALWLRTSLAPRLVDEARDDEASLQTPDTPTAS